MSLLINKSAVRDRAIELGNGRISQVSPFVYEAAHRMIDQFLRAAVEQQPRTSPRLAPPVQMPGRTE